MNTAARKPPASFRSAAPPADLGARIGIPPGKKFSLLNLARAGSAPGAAKKRKPKPGQNPPAAYSY